MANTFSRAPQNVNTPSKMKRGLAQFDSSFTQIGLISAGATAAHQSNVVSPNDAWRADDIQSLRSTIAKNYEQHVHPTYKEKLPKNAPLRMYIFKILCRYWISL